MTKAQLIEIINRRLLVKSHPLVMAKYVELAYSQLLEVTSKGDSSILDQYSTPYHGIQVLFPTTGNPYAVIPVDILSLNSSGGGVRQVYPGVGIDLKFAPMDWDEFSVMQDLEVMEQDPLIPYIQHDDVVEFIGIPAEMTTVKMNLIRSIAGMNDDDQVNMPSGADEQLIEMVVNLLGGQAPDKKANDNTNTVS